MRPASLRSALVPAIVLILALPLQAQSLKAAGPDIDEIIAAHGANGVDRIVGGINAPAGKWPSMVALYEKPPGRQPRFFCGGTTIGSRWILTAAHCAAAMRANAAASYFVREGTQNLNASGAHDIEVVEIVVNEAYVADRALNDIALLRLKDSASSPRQKLISRSLTTPMVAGGHTSTVIGYGRISESGKASLALKQVDIPIVDQPTCTRIYGTDRITAANFCAGTDDRDSCQGDSGGPLFLASDTGEQVQAGIVSWGKGCGQSGFYGVYASVGNFEPWIRGHVSDARFATASTAATTSRPQQAAAALTPGAATSAHPGSLPQVHIDILEGNRFKVGSFIQVRLSSSVSGSLVVFNENPDGTAYQLYPSKTFPGPDGGTRAASIAAGTELRIPSRIQYDQGYRFLIQPPLGPNKLRAIVVPANDRIERIIASHSEGETIADPGQVISRIVNEVDREAGTAEPSRGAVGVRIPDRGSAEVSYDIVN